MKIAPTCPLNSTTMSFQTTEAHSHNSMTEQSSEPRSADTASAFSFSDVQSLQAPNTTYLRDPYKVAKWTHSKYGPGFSVTYEGDFFHSRLNDQPLGIRDYHLHDGKTDIDMRSGVFTSQGTKIAVPDFAPEKEDIKQGSPPERPFRLPKDVSDSGTLTRYVDDDLRRTRPLATGRLDSPDSSMSTVLPDLSDRLESVLSPESLDTKLPGHLSGYLSESGHGHLLNDESWRMVHVSGLNADEELGRPGYAGSLTSISLIFSEADMTKEDRQILLSCLEKQLNSDSTVTAQV